jgi:hypothetical protein
MKLEYTRSHVIATFEDGEEFAGRILIVTGEHLATEKFWLWPESMKWYAPYENEKINRATRKRLTKMLMDKDDYIVLD